MTMVDALFKKSISCYSYKLVNILYKSGHNMMVSVLNNEQ